MLQIAYIAVLVLIFAVIAASAGYFVYKLYQHSGERGVPR